MARQGEWRVSRAGEGASSSSSVPTADLTPSQATPLGLTALGAWPVQTGVFITLIGDVLALFGWGLTYGRRRRLPWPRAVMVGVINASFGPVIVALKLLVH